MPTSTARELVAPGVLGSARAVPGTQAMVSSPVRTSKASGSGIPGRPRRPRPSGEAHRLVIAAWTATPEVPG